jgi:transposase InsO family protein
MRQFNKFKNTQGFEIAWRHLLRFRYMITDEAKRRTKILAFWEKYGTAATLDAFSLSRRTLFRWQKALRVSRGQLDGLNPQGTAPKKRRTRDVPPGMEAEMVRLRTRYPRLGKEKLFPLLGAQGYATSVSTVGRILRDLKHQGKLTDPKRLRLDARTGRLHEKRLKRRAKKRRPKGYRVLEVDTVVRFVRGVKRYLVTGIDTETRAAFAACYTNHGSLSAADFLRRARQVLPDCPDAVQTDNGSEFALHFDAACTDLGLARYHTYPRSPKMNAHVERFNRTLDEEFLRYQKPLLRDDVPAFNRVLIDWLLWYNGERPHQALGQKAPFRAMMEKSNPSECHMWWTHTHPSLFLGFALG